MSLIRHGIDLVECGRIRDLLEKHPRRFLERILTPNERAKAESRVDAVAYVAGRWAAKEATLKMLGTGWAGNISWQDIEISSDPLGAPTLQLSGEALSLARKLGVSTVLISITHTEHYAAASAIGTGESQRDLGSGHGE